MKNQRVHYKNEFFTGSLVHKKRTKDECGDGDETIVKLNFGKAGGSLEVKCKVEEGKLVMTIRGNLEARAFVEFCKKIVDENYELVN